MSEWSINTVEIQHHRITCIIRCKFYLKLYSTKLPMIVQLSFTSGCTVMIHSVHCFTPHFYWPYVVITAGPTSDIFKGLCTCAIDFLIKLKWAVVLVVCAERCSVFIALWCSMSSSLKRCDDWLHVSRRKQMLAVILPSWWLWKGELAGGCLLTMTYWEGKSKLLKIL